MRRPPGLAPGAGPLGGPHFAGGAVGPAAYWRPSRRPGVFCSWCRLGSLWAHGCQRRALHHSAASTRLGSGAPRPAGDGTWSPNPLPPSRHPCAETTRPPAGPCAGWTVWGPAGDTGAGGGRRTLAPAVCPSVCGHSQECGNRSGAGSSGEAAGLLHLRVLTLPLTILPACPRLPHPRPRTPPSATSCLRGSGCPLTAPPYSPRTPAWPCRPRTTLVCLNALQWGPGPLQTSSPDPT